MLCSIFVNMYMYLYKFRFFYPNLQFLNYIIIIKSKVILPLAAYFWLYCICPLVFLLLKTFILFGFFNYFDFECTWWRLFQKCVVRTKFDIYIVHFYHISSLSLSINIPVYLELSVYFLMSQNIWFRL